jgi:CheY-like chemotaxis protein
VLLDIGLPEMDGYEVASRLRQLSDNSWPLLVAVTGYGKADDRERSKAAGFDHHLVKPVDIGELLALCAQTSKTGGGYGDIAECAAVDGRS